jgi:hypothetical protein
MPNQPRWTLPLDPPDIPEGWTTGPPDFVGVGAQRAGTTWWSRCIRKHDQVAPRLGLPKELHYFNRFWNGEVPEDFADTYHRLFPRGEGMIAGEWTPRYMHDFWTIPLLRQAAPDARILVMLRDPVQRYLSGVARAQHKAQEDGGDLNLVAAGDALARSHYGEQVARVFEHFRREQVQVLQLERCQAAPEAELRRTYEFLGIDASAEPPKQLFEQRAGAGTKPTLRDDLRSELVARLRDDVELLSGLCPDIDVALWPDFA